VVAPNDIMKSGARKGQLTRTSRQPRVVLQATLRANDRNELPECSYYFRTLVSGRLVMLPNVASLERAEVSLGIPVFLPHV
jgi:hypothetical protein